MYCHYNGTTIPIRAICYWMQGNIKRDSSVGKEELMYTLPLLQSIYQCKRLCVAHYKFLLSSVNGKGAIIICAESFCRQFPLPRTNPRGCYRAGMLSFQWYHFFDTKGNTPRPIRHRIANIVQQSFEVAYGWDLVNTNRVRCCLAFAL